MTELLIKNIIAEILFENRVCESIEDQWIVNYLYDNLLCEKLLYGQPVTVPELRVLLRKKILNFEFIKLDGEIRPARGTTMMKYIPQVQHPKGIRPSSKKVATFYDLDKKDWRSVSQRSKEIVLKKDEDTGKPIIMVKDKNDIGDIGVTPKTKPEEITKEPKKPEEPKQPEITIDNEPFDKIFPKKPGAIVKNVKPIKSTEKTKMFHFVNPVTGAAQDIEMTPADAIKHLKKIGKDWQLETEKEHRKREDRYEQEAIEPEDILRKGDIRNYLTRKGENIEIQIIAEDPEGGFYAKTKGGTTFKIPDNRIQNIGGKIEKVIKPPIIPKGIINKKEEDLENTEASEL